MVILFLLVPLEMTAIPAGQRKIEGDHSGSGAGGVAS